MPVVTVRGAGGVTVTLSLDMASLPDFVLTGAEQLEADGHLATYLYPGSGGVPDPEGAPLGRLFAMGTVADLGELPPAYIAAAVEPNSAVTVSGPLNDLFGIVNTTGRVILLSRSVDSFAQLGTDNNGMFLAADGARLEGRSAGPVAMGAMPGVVGGAATITAGPAIHVGPHGGNAITADAFDEVLGMIWVTLPGGGVFQVPAYSPGARMVSVVDAPDGDAPATVQGGAGTEIRHLPLSGAAFVTPGNGNATVFGNVGGGTVTVFGGAFEGATAAAFTGRLTVVEGRGVFFGGSAGGNLMATSTAPGATTLHGGGTGDLLLSQGAGHMLIAGAGAETLSGFHVDPLLDGARFFAGGGNATIFGNAGGGNIFGLGPGVSQVDGRNEVALETAALGQGRANTFFVTAPGGGGHVVGDFIPGFDRFDMALTTAVTGQVLDELRFFAIDDAGPENPFAGSGHAGTELTLSGGTAVYFFDAQVTLADLGVVALPG